MFISNRELQMFVSMSKWLRGEVEIVLALLKKGEKRYLPLYEWKDDDINLLIRVCKGELEISEFWREDDDNGKRLAIIKRIKKLAEDYFSSEEYFLNKENSWYQKNKEWLEWFKKGNY